jgi:hypothetical protein
MKNPLMIKSLEKAKKENFHKISIKRTGIKIPQKVHKMEKYCIY